MEAGSGTCISLVVGAQLLWSAQKASYHPIFSPLDAAGLCRSEMSEQGGGFGFQLNLGAMKKAEKKVVQARREAEPG